MNLQRYQELKRRADRLQRDADRAQGEYNAAMRRITKEFGCKTLEEAQTELKRLKTAQVKADRAFGKAMDAFEKEWGDVLQGVD